MVIPSLQALSRAGYHVFLAVLELADCIINCGKFPGLHMGLGGPLFWALIQSEQLVAPHAGPGHLLAFWSVLVSELSLKVLLRGQCFREEQQEESWEKARWA